MSTDDDRQVCVFDPKTLFADVKDGEDGRPILVIGDTNLVVELPAGRDDVDALAAARRIGETVWDYVLAVKMRATQAEQPAGAADASGATESDLLRYVAGNSGPGWPIPGTQKGSSA